MSDFKIAAADLSDQGMDRIAWARQNMPILRSINNRFAVEKPFEGLKIGICLHVEAKTGVWLEALIAGGAEIAITGSPGTTQDEVAAALVSEYGVSVYSWRSETFEEHLENAIRVLETQPDLIADNGADLHHLLNEDKRFSSLTQSIIGATEETTTGANRLREEIQKPDFATLIINDTMAKRIVENRYGVGISVLDGIMRSTNILLAGKKITVIGYGYCGLGVAQRLRGAGAHITVVDKDPLTQLEAHLEGFNTAALEDGIVSADMVVTVTGRPGVLSGEHFEMMKDGVILCNAGHFEYEMDIASLKSLAESVQAIRPNIDQYNLTSGRKVFLLARGNPINLAAGDGNPIEVMDLGLALQSLSLEYLVKHADKLSKVPQTVPYEVETAVAKATLAAWT
ncbi:MAG: adenosylhomocysteinase [Halioglobus sp.]